MNRLIRQYCRRAMCESCERLCQFIFDLIRCQDWYGSMTSASWIEINL